MSFNYFSNFYLIIFGNGSTHLGSDPSFNELIHSTKIQFGIDSKLTGIDPMH